MEENKVATREKLAKLIGEFFVPKIAEYERAGVTVRIFPKEELADAILQSQDLRVTLVEPKYRSIFTEIYDTRANDGEHVLIARTIRDEALAQEIAAWLNSKEPK